jgi:hypothetical protein
MTSAKTATSSKLPIRNPPGVRKCLAFHFICDNDGSRKGAKLPDLLRQEG